METSRLFRVGLLSIALAVPISSFAHGQKTPAAKAPAAKAPTAKAPAAKAPAAKAATEDDFADADDFADVSPVVVKKPKLKRLTVMQIIGRLHPSMVHLPIGWLLLLVLLEILEIRRKERLGPVAPIVLVISVFLWAAAIATGLLRAEETPPDAVVLNHRNLMLISGGLVLLSLPARLGNAQMTRLRNIAYWVFLGAAVVIMVWGGHIGGRVARGPGYLPF
jgi:uncharacterized membrane protein